MAEYFELPEQPPAGLQTFELPPAPQPSVFQKVDDFVRRTANDLTFGFADKLAAKGNEALGYGTYEENIAKERSRTRQAAENIGVPATIAASVLGGVGAGMTMGALGLSPLAYAGPGFFNRVGWGGIEGIMQGGLQAIGESDTGINVKDLALSGGQGGAIGMAVPALGAAARRLITPFSNVLSPTANKQAAVLAREGIELTPAQATGSQVARVAENLFEAIPGGGGSPRMGKQAEQYTGSVLKRAGINATNAEADVLNNNLARLQQNFDDISGRHIVFFDKTFDNTVNKIENKFTKGISPEERGFVQEYIQDLNGLRNRVLTGSDYQNFRSEITETLKDYKDKPKVARVLREIRDAVDTQAEKSIKRVSPQDWELWQKTNREYAVQKTIMRALSAQGADAASGILTPANMRAANRMTGGREAQVRELGALGELTNAAAAILSPQGGQTASRSFASRAIGTGGLLGATALGVYGAGELGGPGYAAASVGAPVAASLLYFSPLGQRYLRNQVMPGNVMPESVQRALTSGIMGLRGEQ